MNLAETHYWLNSIFPEELQLIDIGGVHIGVANLGEEALACTADAAALDTGLVAHGSPMEVRSEIFGVAQAPAEVIAEVLSMVVARLAETYEPAQPGRLLEDLLPADPSRSVRHALLTVPYVWGPESPQMREQPGDVHGPGHGDPALGRLTVLLQLVMLTDAERDFLHEAGVSALQEKLAAEDVDLLDWSR